MLAPSKTCGGIARRIEDIQQVMLQAFLEANLADPLLQGDHFAGRQHGPKLIDRLAAAVLVQDFLLGGAGRIADAQAQEKAVELAFRQGIRSLEFVGILRGQDEERRAQRPGLRRRWRRAGRSWPPEERFWVRGVARLISSAKTTWAKSGPGLKTKLPLG